MAEQTIILLEDDLDGGKADETVLFGLDGVEFEIDLSTANAVRLRAAMARYVANARIVSRTRRGRVLHQPLGRKGKSRVRAAGRPDKLSLHDAATIRAWARQRGRTVKAQGRIPEEIVNAYYRQARP